MNILTPFLAILFLQVQGQTNAPANTGKASRVLGHHRGSIVDLDLMANGHLVSASTDKTVKMWDPSTGWFIKTLHANQVTALKVLPNGNIACASVSDNSIQIWDTEDGTLVKTLTLHTRTVNDLVVLPDGNLASASDDNTIVMWDVASGKARAVLVGHLMPVTSLAVLSSNHHLASASKDQTVKIWDLESNAMIRSIDSSFAQVMSLVALPHEEIGAGLEDGSVKVWSSRDGALQTTLTHGGNVVALASLAESGLLVSGSTDKTVKIWDLDTESLKAEMTINAEITKLVRLENGELAAAGKDGTITIVNTVENTVQRLIGGLRSSAKNLVKLADGNLTCSDGSMIHIWSPVKEAIIKTFNAGSEVTCLAKLPYGDFVSGAKDGTIKRWSLSSDKSIASAQRHSGSVTKLAILSDDYLASASEDTNIGIWDTTSTGLKWIRTIKDHTATVSSLQPIRNATILVSSSLDRSIRFWNPQTGRPTDRPTGEDIAGLSHPIGEMAVIDDSNLAITYLGDNQVTIVNIAKIVPRAKNARSILRGHFGTLTAMSVLPNGQLITGSIDRTIKIWDVPRLKLIKTLSGHSKAPHSVEVLSTGQLVSSSSDEVIKWDYYLENKCEFVGILTTSNLRCYFEKDFDAESLELSSKKIVSISVGAFELFKKVRKLELESNRLTQLEVGAFAGLTAIESLTLFANNLNNLNGQVFEKMPRLKTLNLGSNQLTQLPRDLFKYAPTLTYLDLQNNPISDIDVSVFEQICLTRLDIKDVPVENFLRIKNNGKCLQVFDNRKFIDLTPSLLVSSGYENKDAALTIEITNKSINLIDPNAFSGYTKTRILDLSSNAIEKLVANQFGQLESLEELSLTKNLLETLPNNFFTGLKNLVEVKLNSNFLNQITEQMFEGLEESVEVIDLRDNQIRAIDKDSFKYLKKLKRVYLRGNPVAPPGSNVVTLSQFYCGQRCLVVV